MRLFKRGEASKWDKQIGNRIRDARQEKEWTQTQLAKAVYKSQGNISDYERGRLAINAVDLMFIAIYLEKPITFFFPRRVGGVTQGDLADKEKELIHYTRDIPDEMFELLLDQAKKYREIVLDKIAQRAKREEEKILQQMEERKKKK